MASSIFNVQDLIARLGAGVSRGEGTGNALTVFREDLFLRGIGLDADRVASLGSDDPERARAGWAKRRVNLRDADGRETDIPRVVQIRFQGAERMHGIPDIGISAFVDIPDIGRVELNPRYVLGIPYIQKAGKHGLHEGTRPFVGVLYAPKKPGQAFKFLPFDLLDKVFILGWNHMVDRGKESGSQYGSFDRVEQIDAPVGRTIRIKVAPAQRETMTFDRLVRGRHRDVQEIHYGTLLGKTLVLAPKSQKIPEDLILANLECVNKGQPRTQSIDVQAFERDGSIVIFVGGDDAFLTIDEVIETTNPFDALDMAPDRFSAARARQGMLEWLQRPLNDRNVLYQKGLQYGLIHSGQPRTTVRVTLEAFFIQQVGRAAGLMSDAESVIRDLLKNREFPTLEDCLSGNSLEITLNRLAPNDAAAAWITAQLESGNKYSHTVPFFRGLRRWLLMEVARRANYSDPKPEPEAKTEIQPEPKTDPKADALSATAGANGEAKVPSRKKPRVRKVTSRKKPRVRKVPTKAPDSSPAS